MIVSFLFIKNSEQDNNEVVEDNQQQSSSEEHVQLMQFINEYSTKSVTGQTLMEYVSSRITEHRYSSIKF